MVNCLIESFGSFYLLQDHMSRIFPESFRNKELFKSKNKCYKKEFELLALIMYIMFIIMF